MKARDIFSYSFGAIRLRKLRSGLTTLGIVIGIAAIVALLSYTQGFEVAMTAQFSEGFDTDTLTVSTQMFGGRPGQNSDTSSDFALYVNDSADIEELEYVDFAVPQLSKQSDISVGDMEISSSVSGVDFADYAAMYSTTFVAESGLIPTSPDNDSVIIGSAIYDPGENGTVFADLGDVLTLTFTLRGDTTMVTKNISVTVVGILEEIGSTMGGPSDSGIYIPLETAVAFFETEEIDVIAVQLIDDSEITIDAATAAIEALFDDEVSVTSATAILDTMSTMLGTIELLLGGIAAISLLVAGIGIMNIMIVSTMERTREIGILKALGAKGGTVLAIFLAEAAMIGVLGGVFGIITGGVIALLLSGVLGGFTMGPGGGSGTSLLGSLTTITPVITLDLVIWAIFFGIIVSVVFALYPARRASKLQPVDALRNE